MVVDPQAVHTPALIKYPALHDNGTGPIQVLAFEGHAKTYPDPVNMMYPVAA